MKQVCVLNIRSDISWLFLLKVCFVFNPQMLFDCRRWKLSRELAKIVIKWKDIITINCGGQGCFDMDSRQTLNHVRTYWYWLTLLYYASSPTAKRAHRHLSMILRWFKYRDLMLLTTTFVVYMRPLLQHCAPVWASVYNSDISLII